MVVKTISKEEFYLSRGRTPPVAHEVPQKQYVTYTWENKTIRVEIDQENCCEYSKGVLGQDVLRVCTLESSVTYLDKGKNKIEHPVCPARIYALLYPSCPLRKSRNGGV